MNEVHRIWILEHAGKTFWKEHGKGAYSRNIKGLMLLLENGPYKVRYATSQNQPEDTEWKIRK